MKFLLFLLLAWLGIKLNAPVLWAIGLIVWAVLS